MNPRDAIAEADLAGACDWPTPVYCEHCGEVCAREDKWRGFCALCQSQLAEFQINGADPRR